MARYFTVGDKAYMGDPVTGEAVEVKPNATTGSEAAADFKNRYMQEAKQRLSGTGQMLSSAGQQALGMMSNIPKRGIIGGGAVLAGVPALIQGDIPGAAATTVGGLIGGGIGAAVGGPFAPVTAAIGTAVGSTLGAGLMTSTKAALEKTPQAVSVPTPFGDLPLNTSAQQLKYMQQLGELGLTQQRNALGVQTSAVIDLSKKINDEDLRARQAQFPIMQAEQNADLTRAQALINTQNNAYMQQMVLGGAVNSTLEAQRERGAFMRQAIASNPYVTALAAPSVQIG